MKVLPMMQPWATLVVRGVKTTETRDRHTSLREPVAILATKTTVPYTAATVAWARLADELEVPLSSLLADVGRRGERLLARGKIVGVVTIVDSVASKELPGTSRFDGWQMRAGGYVVGHDQLPLGEFGPGRRVWLLEDPVEFAQPIVCRGMPGIFDAPPAVADEIAAQLGARHG